MKRKSIAAAIAALGIGSFLSMPTEAAVLTGFNDSQVVVDGSSALRTITMGAGTITGLTIKIEFMKCDDPPAGPMTAPLPATCEGPFDAYASEIIFLLTSPGGTEISLVERDTYIGSDPFPGSRITVTFDDTASDFVGANGYTTESAKPVESFASLLGTNAAGDWTLFIGDAVGFDPLGFVRADLAITVDGAAVPEPGSLALLALGLVGLGATSRVRRRFS